MKNSYKGALLILLSTVGFGLMPVFAKYAYKSHISVSTLLMIRFTLASILLFLITFFKDRNIRVSKQDLMGLFLLGGVCYTLQSTLYFSSVKYISASLAVLILYTYPAVVAMLTFLVDGEKLSKRVVGSMAVSFAGLILVVSISIGSVNPAGVFCAAGASVVYSVYIILGNRVIKNVSPVLTTSYVTMFTVLGLLVTGLLGNTIHFDFHPGVWLPVAGLVFFSTILAILTFFGGLEILGSTKSSVLSMMEPVFAILFSAVFLGEGLNVYQALGGLAVIIGAVLVIKSQGKKEG